MSRLDEVGSRDSWRCWICDEAVDAAMSVNDPRGPSIDSLSSNAKAKAKSKRHANSADFGNERLAHRDCNTKKGAVAPVIPWPDYLFVVDPSPIIGSVDRLARKGGQEVVARCPTQADADDAAAWLGDRVSRLIPGLDARAEVESGGGHYLVILRR